MKLLRGRGRAGWSLGGGRDHLGTLYARLLGSGPPILLLHGLVGSSRYWGSPYDLLGEQHQLIVPDLLGFARSPKPPSGYGPDDHVEAIVAVLDEVEAPAPAVVVGHSAGAVVALRLAHRHPERVRAVLCFGPPLFRDRNTARRTVGAMGPMARLFALPGPLAAVTCGWVCNHRELAARVAVLTQQDLPAEVAADSVHHTWASYTGTMTEVVLAAVGSSWLPGIAAPVTLVVGDADRAVDRGHLADLAALGGVDLLDWEGDHHLPLRQPSRCADLIAAAAA